MAAIIVLSCKLITWNAVYTCKIAMSTTYAAVLGSAKCAESPLQKLFDWAVLWHFDNCVNIPLYKLFNKNIFCYIFVCRSEEWDSLTSNERNKMGLTFQSDGEFWMPFSEFCTFFTHVEICHFVNTSFFSLKKTWTESLLRGEWTTGAKDSKKDRSGGCDDFDSYLENPQVCS